MLRALGISIIAHLLVLSFFYERMLDNSSAEGVKPTIQAEIVQAAPAVKAGGGNIAPQVVQLIEHRKKDKTVAKTVSMPEEIAVTNPAVSGQPAERLATVDVAIERRSESVAASVRPISQDGLRQYGINVAREARKYKRFPAMARQRGWEGEVSVVIGSTAGALLPVVSLNKGSGFDALDQAALEMVRSAVRDAPMPDELYGRAFALTLPIRFSLED